jgi:probable O-glycosylation ligase (exosortase A-associated)
MRDLIVTLIVVGSLPLILMRPYVGVLMMAWIGYMNPHKLGWGFAAGMPFVMGLAIVTVIAMMFSKEKKRIPWTIEVALLLLFIVWMMVTTAFALEPNLAPAQLEKVLKIQIITLATFMLINTKERIEQLVAVIVVSFGLYGVKGGIFTVLTGGGYHVMGPMGTFIGGNNEIGLALIMTIPLMRYLQVQVANKWIKLALIAAIMCTIVAVLGTQSRGALVGLATMGAFLVFKSKQKFTFLVVIVMLAPLFLAFMPQSWWNRMGTIENYQQDESALGRFNAWHFAFNLAVARPLTGGGYEVFRQPWFSMYAPDPNNVHDAHSIYFEVLGEQGFIGLAIFLSLLMMTWFSGSGIIKACKGDVSLLWMENLARMLQVSLIGYMTAGAFLGLAYFDFIYHIVAIMVLLKVMLRDRGKEVDEGPKTLMGGRFNKISQKSGARLNK